MTLQSQDAFALQAGESLLPLAFRRVLTGCAASFAAAVAIAYVFASLFPLQPQVSITDYFFRTQDALWVILIAGFLAACAFLRFPTTVGATFTAARLCSPRLVAFALIALVFIFGAAGSALVFDNFHLSRDEVLAEFDAQIFQSGHLIAPVDPEWRLLRKRVGAAFHAADRRRSRFCFALSARQCLPSGVGWYVGRFESYRRDIDSHRCCRRLRGCATALAATRRRGGSRPAACRDRSANTGHVHDELRDVRASGTQSRLALAIYARR